MSWRSIRFKTWLRNNFETIVIVSFRNKKVDGETEIETLTLSRLSWINNELLTTVRFELYLAILFHCSNPTINFNQSIISSNPYRYFYAKIILLLFYIISGNASEFIPGSNKFAKYVLAVLGISTRIYYFIP